MKDQLGAVGRAQVTPHVEKCRCVSVCLNFLLWDQLDRESLSVFKKKRKMYIYI